MPSSEREETLTHRLEMIDKRLKESNVLFEMSLEKFESLKQQRMERSNMKSAPRSVYSFMQPRTPRKRKKPIERSVFNRRTKTFEKPKEGSWVTSGPVGSRDAVLVFRTSILNSKNVNDGNAANVQDVLANNTSRDDCNGGDNPSPRSVIANFPNGDIPLVHSASTTANVLTSLPSNTNIEKTCSSLSCSHILSKNKTNDSKPPQVANHKDHHISPKKNFHWSLSSSESTSSEYDDTIPVEEDLHPSGMKPIGTVSDLGLSQGTDTDDLIRECDLLPKCDISYDYNKENVREEDQPFLNDMPALKLKITYKFMNTETRLLKKIFIRHGLTEADDEHTFNILWTGVHMKPDILRNLTPYQRVNHFPRSYELTRKDRLYKNIEKMQHLRGFKHFDIVPESYVLPLEYKDLLSAHNKYRGPWIVKPACSSRGRGIFIVNSPDQISPDEQGLVSKYVAHPLCIDGHKCDLRVYVLVTSFDPLLIYIYKEGLVRLATVKYNRSAENLWNPCMHLCNYSINKYHSDYIKSRDAQVEDVGHKWTLSALLRHLKSQGCNTQHLMANIEDLIIKSIFSTAQSIIAACRMFVPNGTNCFELYGFDILVDDTLKPWLLEINLSPSMGVDSPIDTKVKAALMTDLLTLVGIPAYSPMVRAHYDSTWSRFRNVSYGRRTNSADHIGTSRKTSIVSQKLQKLTLTAEEQRMIRNVRLQNARRGGFVRVFPTEDSMQKYSNFLDPLTGIPLSTGMTQNQTAFAMVVPHNYNLMVYNHIYGKDSKGTGYQEENSYLERMNQYECVLESWAPISFARKRTEPKCIEEGTRLRKQIRRLIENGTEMTLLQTRQTFGRYLEFILRRLTQEPRDYHEKLILKFLIRSNGIKAPVFFKNPFSYCILSKDRSAMVAKLLGDYLEGYNKDTEAYIDTFDSFGKISISLYNEFLSHAQEADLESVLTLHTNLTHTMPFLYNRCGPSVPLTPPIPTGPYGFLKALPSMVMGNMGSREMNRIDIYYRNQRLESSSASTTTSTSVSTSLDPTKKNTQKRPMTNHTKKLTPLRR